MFGWKGGAKAADGQGNRPGHGPGNAPGLPLPAGTTDMLGGLGDRMATPWRRPRRRIQAVAVLCSLLAGALVFGIFNGVSRSRGEARPEKLLIGSIDMGIAYREQGQTQARADIASGLLQLLFFGPAEPRTDDEAMRAEKLKRRYGIVRVSRGDAPTPQSQSYVDGYNRVVRAEIKRRHGQPFLDELLRDEEAAAKPDKPADSAADKQGRP